MFRQFSMFVFLVFATTTGLSNTAHAQAEPRFAPADEILTTLLSYGYVIVENERTWLGRQRILAEKEGRLREVVFVPGTGEILRDYSAEAPLLVLRPLEDEGHSRGAEVSVGGGRKGVSAAGNTAPSVGAGPNSGSAGMVAPADIGILP